MLSKTREHTKLLKLLFLIDKVAIEETGVPVIWLDYHAWKLGPVSPSIFNLKFSNSGFEDFVQTKTDNSGTIIQPVREFSEDEFSGYELGLIHRMIKRYKNTTGPQLVNLTHEKTGLWYLIVSKHNLEALFETDGIGISPFKIDLTQLISENSDLLDNYQIALESLQMLAALNEKHAEVW